jgi:predicted nucleic-acid-binding Zn-ribbon protein
MSLTDAQKASIEDWLNSHAAEMLCPCCREKQWCIQDDLAFPLMIDPETARINRESGFPLVVVVCNNCGYASFFSAVRIGVIKMP